MTSREPRFRIVVFDQVLPHTGIERGALAATGARLEVADGTATGVAHQAADGAT